MTKPSIAIIGGGFCGTALAIHLAKTGRFGVSIFEPRAEIGRGLAYDSHDPVHRINVPASRMSLYTDDMESFSRYLKAHWPQDDDKLCSESGDPFPRRQVFGDYVLSEAKPHLKSGAITHHQAQVIAVRRQDDHWALTDQNGVKYQTDIVVLAATHPSPDLPRGLHPLKSDSRLIHQGAQAQALDGISADASVLVVGTGLTAADTIAGLLTQGHKGPITALSRRGLRSRGHAKIGGEYEADFTAAGQTALELLRKTRREIAMAAAEGVEWQVVFDRLRAQGQVIWRDLSPKSRRQIVRHLRPYWDVHRFRIAPQVEQVLDQAIARGQLRVMAAQIRESAAQDQGLWICVQAKGKAKQALEFKNVIVTTGPAHGSILQSQPLFQTLADQGLIRLCPTGLGLLCDLNSQALSADSRTVEGLFICGPLARGTFGELMGLPQVSQHAQDLAIHLRQNAKHSENIKV